jgi:hypothetical protein
MTLRMERRLLYIPVLHIDTNLINARQSLESVNQLEHWFATGVVLINMSGTAHQEAQAGRNPQRAAKANLRVLTIFDGLIFTLFEVHYPFRFPHAVGESGKRKWELDRRRRVASRYADHYELKAGLRAGSPRDRARSAPCRSVRSDARTKSRCERGTVRAVPRWGAGGSLR